MRILFATALLGCCVASPVIQFPVIINNEAWVGFAVPTSQFSSSFVRVALPSERLEIVPTLQIVPVINPVLPAVTADDSTSTFVTSGPAEVKNNDQTLSLSQNNEASTKYSEIPLSSAGSLVSLDPLDVPVLSEPAEVLTSNFQSFISPPVPVSNPVIPKPVAITLSDESSVSYSVKSVEVSVPKTVQSQTPVPILVKKEEFPLTHFQEPESVSAPFAQDVKDTTQNLDSISASTIEAVASIIDNIPVVKTAIFDPSVDLTNPEPITYEGSGSVDDDNSKPVVAGVEPDVHSPLNSPDPPVPSIGTPFEGGNFHAQDEMGQYSFGHWGGPNTRIENRDANGRTSGSFAYVDPDGQVQVRKYSADSTSGFRVAASDLPFDVREG